jgi:hypothetical protein
VQGRGVSHSRSVAGQSTKCRASRCSFLLGGFRVRVGQPHELPRIAVLLPAGWVPGSGGSAPRSAAHRGAPSCWVGSGFGWVSPTNCRASRCSFLPVSVTQYLSRLYTTDLRLARLERQSVGNVT